MISIYLECDTMSFQSNTDLLKSIEFIKTVQLFRKIEFCYFGGRVNYQALSRFTDGEILCHFRIIFFFFCVEVLRPSQPNGVMLSAASLSSHTFTGQA